MKKTHENCDQKSKRFGSWEKYSDIPPWSVVTSRELTKIYAVSLNTINSWKMREILPSPVKHPKLPKGNRNYFRISEVRSKFEDKSEQDLIWEWANHRMPDFISQIHKIGEIEYLANILFQDLGLKKSLIPCSFK